MLRLGKSACSHVVHAHSPTCTSGKRSWKVPVSLAMTPRQLGDVVAFLDPDSGKPYAVRREEDLREGRGETVFLFGVDLDAAEASALGMVSVDSPFSLPYPSITHYHPDTTQIPLKY